MPATKDGQGQSEQHWLGMMEEQTRKRGDTEGWLVRSLLEDSKSIGGISFESQRTEHVREARTSPSDTSNDLTSGSRSPPAHLSTEPSIDRTFAAPADHLINVIALCHPDGTKLETFHDHEVDQLKALQKKVDKVLDGKDKSDGKGVDMWSSLPKDLRLMLDSMGTKGRQRFKVAQEKLRKIKANHEARKKGVKRTAPAPAVQPQPTPSASNTVVLTLPLLNVAATPGPQLAAKIVQEMNDLLKHVAGIDAGNVKIVYLATDSRAAQNMSA